MGSGDEGPYSALVAGSAVLVRPPRGMQEPPSETDAERAKRLAQEAIDKAKGDVR